MFPSYLCNEVFIKPQKNKVSSFRIDEHLEVPGRWCTQKGHGCSELLPPISHLCISSFASFVISLFFHFICISYEAGCRTQDLVHGRKVLSLNYTFSSVFLNSVCCSSKLTEPEVKVCGNYEFTASRSEAKGQNKTKPGACDWQLVCSCGSSLRD